jgi:hypothetical protein
LAVAEVELVQVLDQVMAVAEVVQEESQLELLLSRVAHQLLLEMLELVELLLIMEQQVEAQLF